MNRADCRNCRNRVNRPYWGDQSYRGDCAFSFRWASTAGGSEPEDMQDVYWCRDYDEEIED